jgi:pyridoxamine 5'-phosphate oxidase
MSKVNQHISMLREDFNKGELLEVNLCKTPDLQFEQWMKEAIDAKVNEVQACNLATVDEQHKPSARIVYLREFFDNEFYFYTNYNSKKANDMAKNPNVCLTFFWPELERQIRIEGVISGIASADKSDAYFNVRPLDSKIGAWSSPQSSVLRGREELNKFVLDNKEKYQNS